MKLNNYKGTNEKKDKNQDKIIKNKNESKETTVFNKSYMVMILALISCFLWGSAFPSVKVGYEIFSIAGNDTYQKITFAGFRFLISAIMIFIFCMVTGRTLKIKKEDLSKVAFLGIVQTSIQYVFFYIGLSNTTGTKGSILAATTTFFSVIIAHFFYKEDKLSFRRIVGVVLGFIGVAIVNMNGGKIQGGFTFTGEGFVVISSLVGALAGIYTKKISKDISTFAISSYQLFIGSIFLIVSGFMGGARGLNFTPKGAVLLLYLGFISAAAFSIWTVLLKYNGVGKVTIYKFSIPLFGVFLSYVFLGERSLGTNVIIAVILVILGIILINTEPKANSNMKS
ncbi:DMT superfamily permease [Clostridium putrefaciens]|uniref:DMT superfamily permease n=1 Tax=Clostridium putrefaciens TaxID=99675 RepID=A0A381J7D9_9CLOT|nr:DMT family transporter [Clostridium putrefaciens]SUY46067.1 DMT superfamily permease [Clostridium putrefaciens]